MVVAIDGPAGVGKSTIAKMIAEKSDLYYINSGNFYRSITYFSLKRGVAPNHNEQIIEVAKSLDFSMEDGELLVDGKRVEAYLHTDEVDRWVAKQSSIIEVREVVNQALRHVAASTNVIIEGRDITTVVFPDADLKVYFDASLEARAQRRFGQGTSRMSLEEIRESIRKRDEIDTQKAVGSLKISQEALYLDTSDLTINQVCEKVLSKIYSI